MTHRERKREIKKSRNSVSVCVYVIFVSWCVCVCVCTLYERILDPSDQIKPKIIRNRKRDWAGS